MDEEADARRGDAAADRGADAAAGAGDQDGTWGGIHPHSSCHGRAALAGGPKSRGASPAWNQVTKL